MLQLKSALLDVHNAALLAKVLPGSSSVKKLNFSDCGMDHNMLKYVVDAIEGEASSVRHVALDFSPLPLPLQPAFFFVLPD